MAPRRRTSFSTTLPLLQSSQLFLKRRLFPNPLTGLLRFLLKPLGPLLQAVNFGHCLDWIFHTPVYLHIFHLLPL